MKIFIEIPTWLGDAVMCTPAIENIVSIYPNCKLVIFGSFVSTALFKYHPNIEKIIIDNSKKEGFRYINLYKLAKQIDHIDMAFSFRKNFTTKYLLYFIDAKEKYIYKRMDSSNDTHQVIRYNQFVNDNLQTSLKPNKLKIYTKDILKDTQKRTLGINPGATYGSAKRWYPKEFAKVCIELSKEYNIKIFGGPNETNIAYDIEEQLKKNNIINYENLAGKTTIDELISFISTLDMFITNDSGPMHVAAAFDIPTIAIFGPTRYKETSAWMNKNFILLRKDISCSPCMKRVCPLKHHNCMKQITAQDVLDIIKKII